MTHQVTSPLQRAHLSKEQKAKVQQYGVECMKKTGVSMELVAQAKKGQFADDEKLKNFILCFFQKTGVLTSDGKLNEEVALAKLPQEVDKVAVKKVLDECKMKNGKNVADTAFEIFKCYYKATPAHVSF